jgi:hypothetical protein
MKRAEWEEEYGKSEHTCAHGANILNFTKKTRGLAPIPVKRAGVSTKASYECDLWEHK